MSEEEPRIIIDSDWKKEAQQEKERVAEDEASGEAAGPLPEPHFLELVNMISMQAAISLGGFKTPDGKVVPPDIHAAKHYIDLLEILQKKTENNLEDQEAAVFRTTLHELRLAYIQMATAAVDQASAERPPAQP